jgi:RNA 2',3'-cyclic 3'-phosphodiesterase
MIERDDESEEQWRVFVAIELPAEIRSRVANHIVHLREALPDARASWNREDNLHLTLKFLGDIPASAVNKLSQAVANAAHSVRPIELNVSGTGTFPKHGTPRVLWIGIDEPGGRLDELYRELENSCAKAGFAREARPFHPHLTVARLRKPHGARRLGELHNQMQFPKMSFIVRELTVIRSKLSSEGSQYTALSRHALKS